MVDKEKALEGSQEEELPKEFSAEKAEQNLDQIPSAEEGEQENFEQAVEEEEKPQPEDQESKEKPATGEPAGLETAEEPPEEPREPNKARLFFRKVLIWLVVIAVSFAAGFFVDSYLRYQPEKNRAERLAEELSSVEERISELEGEIERLAVFEEANQALQKENDSLRTHLTILSARSAVADASLALADDNLAEAKLALDKVGTTLEKLTTMLNEDQLEVVENMQQRHQLIMEELEEDSFSARSDLEVLSSKLGTLENALFAVP